MKSINLVRLLYGLGFLLGFTIALFLGTVITVYLGRIISAGVVLASHYTSGVSTPFGRIRVQTKSEDNRGLWVDASCLECSLKDSRIAPDVLTTDKAKLHGYYSDERFRGELKIDELTIQVDTSWKHSEASGTFILRETPIEVVIRAIPVKIPELEHARISGTVSAQGTFTWPPLDLFFEPKIRAFRVEGIVSKAAYARGAFTYLGRDVQGQDMVITSGEGTDNWLSLRSIGMLLPDAIISVEDGKFFSHPGYDLPNMMEAMSENHEQKAIRRGGSTITQQLAKNLFLNREKTYVRKLRELLYAVSLEKELGKNRILELYLNVVQWGPGIHGAKAAAKAYFNKLPSELLPAEAAWLAIILRNPIRAWEKQYVRNKPNTRLLHLALARMRSRGKITQEQMDKALAEPIHFFQKPA